MSRSKPPHRSAYHHGNLREALLDAAEQLLVHTPPEQLTLREVARQAGVSHGAPYHHFAGRDALLAAVAERGFDGLAEAMALAAGATPLAKLVAICEAYVEFAVRHPARFQLMFGPVLASQSAEHPALKAAGHRAFGILLHAAQELDAVQAMPLALAGWSMAHGLAHLRIHDVLPTLPVPVPPAPALARQLAEWVLQSRVPTQPRRKRQ